VEAAEVSAWRVPAIVVLAFCAGCVKVEQDLIINEDASGSLDLKYSISETAVQQIEAMHKLRKDLDEAAGRVTPPPQGTDFSRLLLSPILDEIRGKLKEYEKAGIRIERLDVKSRDARRSVEIKLQFDSLAKVSGTDFFKQFGFSLTKDANGNYLLDRAPQVAEAPAGIRFDDPQVVRTLTPLLAGFSVTLGVRTPGKILSSTASIKGPYTAGWRFEFDRDPGALTALLTQRFAATFDGKGLNLPEIRATAPPPSQDTPPASTP
jgi:hypothetical protein